MLYGILCYVYNRIQDYTEIHCANVSTGIWSNMHLCVHSSHCLTVFYWNERFAYMIYIRTWVWIMQVFLNSLVCVMFSFVKIECYLRIDMLNCNIHLLIKLTQEMILTRSNKSTISETLFLMQWNLRIYLLLFVKVKLDSGLKVKKKTITHSNTYIPMLSNFVQFLS